MLCRSGAEREAYVSPATWKKLIDRVDRTNHGFADGLRFLDATGCRPSEAFHVEAPLLPHGRPVRRLRGSIKVLADLIGTSVAMIERHHGHLMVDKERVRSIMNSVTSGRR